jgi:phosphate transport system protein
MRIRFHQSLDDLKEKLLVMAGMAEQAIQRAIEAYRTRDTSICDLVMHGELAINKLEREIDQMALDLLAMEQPMAIDLRFILAVIKINADLERVGDQAVNIAERVCDLNAFAAAEMPVDIPHMASLASSMVRKALQSFIEGDAELAASVLAMDDQVDKMNETAYYSLSLLIKRRTLLRMSSSGCAARTFGIIRASRKTLHPDVGQPTPLRRPPVEPGQHGMVDRQAVFAPPGGLI